MSALPRPALTGPTRALNDALHDLHHRAGWPSLRTLARETGVSHTTVSKAFSQPALPTWGTLELLVEAMRGDTGRFHDLWLAASAPTDGAPAPALAPAPRIAGRRAELETVRRHLETGTGLLLVTGEAGIGKSTIVDAALSASGVPAAVGHCRSTTREGSFSPIADALRSVFDVDGELFGAAIATCPPFVRDTLGLLVPEVGGSSAEVPDDWATQRMFAALVLLLVELRASSGLVLVLEDLHWADASTLDLLDVLLARRSDVALLGTWRTDQPDLTSDRVEWLVRARRHPGTSVVQVGNLSREDMQAQVTELVGRQVPVARVDRMYARTLGHPLFTAQLAVAGEDGELPGLLGDLLDTRLVRVSDDEWVVARALGVADRPLSATVLAGATGLSQELLTAALRGLAAEHLLSYDDHTAWLAHPMLAEGVRRRLVPGEAPEVHSRLAHLLAEHGRTSAAEVAGHHREAGDTAGELQWRIRAAQAARAQAAFRQAADHWERALDIWDDDAGPGCTRGSAVLATVDALNGAGDDVAALRLARDAYASGDGALTPDDRLLLGLRVAGIAWGQQGAPHALTILDEAMVARGQGIPPDAQVRCLRLRASLLSKTGRNAEALAVLAEAMAQRDLVADPDVTVRLLSTHGWHLAFAGDLGDAQTSFEEAGRRIPDELRAVLEVHVAMMRTDAMLFHARPAAEVAEAARDALCWITDLDLRSAIDNMVRSNVAFAWLHAGQPTRAAALLPDRRWDDDYAEWPLRVVAARVALARGALDDALRHLSGPIQNDDFARLDVAVPRAEALLWAGRHDEAASDLAELLEGLAGDTTMIGGRAFTMLARAVADSGSGGDGAARLRTLRGRMAIDPLGPGPVPVERPACTAQWLAELDRSTGCDGASGWSRVADAWDRLDRPHDAAYCRWRAAQCALGDGKGTLAARLLAKAAAQAREHVPLSEAIAATRSGR